jgi:hypothetical protein
MKTTLDIDDELLVKAKAVSARERKKPYFVDRGGIAAAYTRLA